MTVAWRGLEVRRAISPKKSPALSCMTSCNWKRKTRSQRGPWLPPPCGVQRAVLLDRISEEGAGKRGQGVARPIPSQQIGVIEAASHRLNKGRALQIVGRQSLRDGVCMSGTQGPTGLMRRIDKQRAASRTQSVFCPAIDSHRRFKRGPGRILAERGADGSGVEKETPPSVGLSTFAFVSPRPSRGWDPRASRRTVLASASAATE